MKAKSKKGIIRDLNTFLLIRNISWDRLLEKDLAELHKALMKLKCDVVQVFQLPDECPYSIEDLKVKTEKPPYCI